MIQEPASPSTSLKLNDPVKVVKIPVTGQPGHYITGILPFERQADAEEPAPQKKALKPWMRTVLAIVIVALVLASLGILTTVANHNQLNTQQTSAQTTSQTSANSPAAQATATASANILVSDPLNRNINNWLTQPPSNYAFKDGAYHITVTSGDKGNGVVLPGKSFDVPLTYTLTMQEIKGDDTTTKNTFGMIMRFNQQMKNGKQNTTFYTFEVENVKGKDYQFWRYDDSKANPWTLISGGQIPTGKEFHQGKASNTIAITMNGSAFTVVVNGTKLSKVFHDSTFKTGSVGMIVNNSGTEVAFKNLLVTRQ
jgi:hypothetical protein